MHKRRKTKTENYEQTITNLRKLQGTTAQSSPNKYTYTFNELNRN